MFQTEKATRREFHIAMPNGDAMVFVEDSKNRILQSYRFPGSPVHEELEYNPMPMG